MQDIINSFLSHYTWYIAIIHFLAAIILFYIVNWIGARSISIGYMQMSIIAKDETAPAFNFLYKVISPIVFFVLFIVAVQSSGHNELVQYSFLIIIYYWLFRTTVIVLLGRGRLTNWPLHFSYWLVSISLSVWIYTLVEQVGKLLPNPRSLLDQMWILIIMFIYSVLNNLEISREGTIKRKKNYINNKYRKFKTKYGSIITENCLNEFYEVLTYSIMICENFNRPTIVRQIEYLCFFITQKPHTLGIMQVRTDKYLNDKASIVKAIGIIKQATLKHKREVEKDEDGDSYDSPINAVYQISSIYNCNNEDYISEVCSIFETIKEKYNNIDENYNNINSYEQN